MEKKRLLKDLPFHHLIAGTVLTKGDGGYYEELGDCFFSPSGTGNHRGWDVLEKAEIYLLDTIWNNSEWFEAATLNHIDIKTCTDKIILSFKPLDLGQAQTFAKGLFSCLENYGNEDIAYTWQEFKGFTKGFK